MKIESSLFIKRHDDDDGEGGRRIDDDDMGIRQYSRSSGWGTVVQNKKYTEYGRPPQNGGATK